MSTISINTPTVKNIVTVVNDFNRNCSYFEINGIRCGAIGGSKKDIEVNRKCIEFMANNVDSNNPNDIMMQCATLPR